MCKIKCVWCNVYDAMCKIQFERYNVQYVMCNDQSVRWHNAWNAIGWVSCHSSGSLKGGCPSSAEVIEDTEGY